MPRIPWPPILVLLLVSAGWWLQGRWPLDWLEGMTGTRWIGGLLLAAAVGIEALVARHFRRYGTTVLPNRRASALVTGGPFAYSRNPIYVGHVTGTLGAGLVMANPYVSLAAPLLALLVTVLAIRPEEAYLSDHFGSAYDDYRARVRRWL